VAVASELVLLWGARRTLRQACQLFARGRRVRDLPGARGRRGAFE